MTEAAVASCQWHTHGPRPMVTIQAPTTLPRSCKTARTGLQLSSASAYNLGIWSLQPLNLEPKAFGFGTGGWQRMLHQSMHCWQPHVGTECILEGSSSTGLETCHIFFQELSALQSVCTEQAIPGRKRDMFPDQCYCCFQGCM